MKKALACMALALWIITGSLGALTVRVVLYQSAATGTQLPNDGFMTSLSEAIIAGALTDMFESGVIGIDDRPRNASPEVFRDYRPGADAVSGFIEYELVIHAEYHLVDGTLSLPKCRYRYVRVVDGMVVFSGEQAAVVPRSRSLRDLQLACSSMGAQMIRESLKAR